MNCLRLNRGLRQSSTRNKLVCQPRSVPRVGRVSCVQVVAGRANKKKWRKWRESAKQWLYSEDFTKEERAVLHNKGITIEMIYNFMQMGYTKDEIFQFGQHVKVERKFQRPWQEYLKDYYGFTHDEIKTLEIFLDKRGLTNQLNKDFFKKKVKMIKEFMKMDQPQVQQFISKNKDVLRLPEQQLTSRLQRVQDWSLLPFWRRDIRRWPGILNYDTRWIQQRIAFICEAIQIDENLALDMWAKEPKLLEFRQGSIHQLIEVMKQENMDLETIRQIFMQNPSAMKNSKTSLQTRLQVLNNSGIAAEEVRQVLQKESSVLGVDFMDANVQLTIAFFDKLLKHRFGKAIQNNPQLFTYDLKSQIAPRIYFLKQRKLPVTNLKVILYWPDIEFCLQVAACELYEYHQFLSQEWYTVQWPKLQPRLQEWRKEINQELRKIVKIRGISENEEEADQFGLQYEQNQSETQKDQDSQFQTQQVSEFQFDENSVSQVDVDQQFQSDGNSEFQSEEDYVDDDEMEQSDSKFQVIGGLVRQPDEQQELQRDGSSKFLSEEDFVDDVDDNDPDFLISDDSQFQNGMYDKKQIKFQNLQKPKRASLTYNFD